MKLGALAFACLVLPTAAAVAQGPSSPPLNNPDAAALMVYGASGTVVDDGGTAATAQPAPAAAPAQGRRKASVLASLDPAKIPSMIINDPSAPNVSGAKSRLVDDPRVTGDKALRVQIPAKGKNAWDSSVSSEIKQPVKAGDNLLLVTWARLEQGENGATTTTLPWNSIGMTSPPWSGVLGEPADIGPEWKQIEIKGRADKDYAAGTLGASLQLATAKQVIDLGPVIVLNLGQ